ncbi:hypothetical protein BDN72DRAFT_836563 [Pluteus cervinus]|uniref:Uncharacterized protein n=1 Tax=Pluteus cervinus TaxID=181527 RepID=A0ACD3B315_9AGAR|nr:hypothetical protein BDN72DRAFT_836563 [Pluteus cervinus]
MSTSPYTSTHASPRLSSRASYPTFLSAHASLQLQLRWIWRGLYDAFRWNVVFSTIVGDAEIRANVYKSLMLNSLSLTSIYAFDLLVFPLVKDQERWLHRNLGWFYQALWLFPVVGASFYLNSSWCSIIAKRTYALQYGLKSMAPQPTTYTGLLTALATSAYRAVMVMTSVVVSFTLQTIPYVGPIASFTFLCWIDSYYCFEFVWIARGMSLAKRIRHIEERWAYYFAFGLPSAALCTFGTGLANAAIFALIYPAYIILAMNARPVPQDPYNPMPLTSGDQDVIRHPSPFVPIRIPIFAVVLWLNDAIVKVLNVGGGKQRIQGRPRANSDPTEVEQGEVIELENLERRTPKVVPRPPKARINLGRRKAD